jgi:hypothetical protein
MRAVVVALPFFVLAVAGAASGQSRDYTAGAPISSPRVIIPWTHFGQDPPEAAEVPAQPASPRPTPALPNVPSSSTWAGVSVPPTGALNEQPESSATGLELYEADISQAHPHPPEPVDLPLADQDTAPLLEVLPTLPRTAPRLESLPAGATAASSVELGDRKGQNNSPEGQIAQLTASYKQREASRNARRAQLLAAGRNDPATQDVAQVEVTRLLLEGENDRRTTSQQLAKAFASLGEELDARARAVHDLIDSRKQAAVTAEADLSHLKSLMPQRELALRNLAMLPPSNQNDSIIRELNAELTQEQDTRKLDEETSQESRSEIKALQAEADELEQAAGEARQSSTRFADAAEAAQVNERLLADRLEYSVAHMRASDLLTSASKALGHSGSLRGSAQLGPLPGAGAIPALMPTGKQATDQLRDCIRKTGDLDACRAKEGQ